MNYISTENMLFYKNLFKPLSGLKTLIFAAIISSLLLTILEGVSIALIVPFLSLLHSGDISFPFFKNLAWSLSSSNSNIFYLFCSLLIIVIILKSVPIFFSHYFISSIESNAVRKIRKELRNSFFNLSYCDYAALDHGFYLHLYTSQTGIYASSITNLLMLFDSVSLFVVYGAILFFWSWKFTLLVFSLFAVGFTITFLINKKVFANSNQEIKYDAQVTQLAADDLKGFQEIAAFNLRDYFNNKHELIEAKRHQFCLKEASWQGLSSPAIEILLSLLVVSICLVVFSFNPTWFRSNIPLFLGFFYIYLKLNGWFTQIVNVISSFAEQKSAIKNIINFTNKKVPAPKDTYRGFGEVEFLELKSLNFHYSKNSLALQNINLRLKKGDFAILAGETGCGKTTLARLMCGLLESKEVFLNGMDTASLNKELLSKKIGVVFQDPHIFNETIWWNISCGRNYSLEKISEAANLAEIGTFVSSLKNQYSTKLGEQGIQLSRGQRQRLAIARALLGSPDVLILDEATSALDSATEEKIISNLRLHKKLILFLITHRPFLLEHATKIFVMKTGQIIAEGSHSLLTDNEEYLRIFGRSINKKS